MRHPGYERRLVEKPGEAGRLAVVELEVLLYGGQLGSGDGSNAVNAYMANPAMYAPPGVRAPSGGEAGEAGRLAMVELEVLLYEGQLGSGDGSNAVVAYMANPAMHAPPGVRMA